MNVTDFVTPFSVVAVIVAVPAETALTFPFVSTAATEGLSLDQVIAFPLFASEGVYSTESLTDSPTCAAGATGLITIAVTGISVFT